MQSLGIDFIKEIKRVKIQKLEENLREIVIGNGEGLMVCPFCNYASKKNPKGSAKVFEDLVFKCFSCGIWRKV